MFYEPFRPHVDHRTWPNNDKIYTRDLIKYRLYILDKMLARVSTFFRVHPMLKGMAVYSVTWPTSSVVQQLMNKEDLDWRKSLRFFMFGTFFVAPTLYGWIKLSSSMWPTMSLKTGIAKAAVEQFSYGPAASVSFFTLMTLMEGRGFDAACSEVSEKFPRTYRGEERERLFGGCKFSANISRFSGKIPIFLLNPDSCATCC